MFLKPEKLQNHSNKGKGNEKKKAGRRKGGEEKKAMVALLVFKIATLEIVFDRRKNCWTQKVLDIQVFKNTQNSLFIRFR